jgi:hypothetical protein
MPVDAYGCVNQARQSPQTDELALCGPPLYGRHILDQPYLAGSFLAGFPYEMGPPYDRHAQSGLSVTYGRLDSSEYCSIPVPGDNVGNTSEAVEGSSSFVSSPYTPRDTGHFNLGDLPLGDLPSYCTATLESPPANSPILPPNYESVDPLGLEHQIDEYQGLSDAYLASC